jgi:succinate dehydrogenase / fumarate reductase cytochrome b subunit
MSSVSRFFRSTVGTKAVMAVTGVALYGFLVTHMLANLQLWMPPKDGVFFLDKYARGLRDLGILLWVARGGLLAALVLHIASAVKLMRLQRRARPQAYALRKDGASTLWSRTMRYTAVAIFLFIPYHILHFTGGVAHAALFKAGHVHENVIRSFSQPQIAGIYVVAQLLLLPHLAHGGYSFFRSLGLENARQAVAIKTGAVAFATILCLGFLTAPLGVVLGLVK